MSMLSVGYKNLSQALYIGKAQIIINQIKFAISSKYELYVADAVPEELTEVDLVMLEYNGDDEAALANIHQLLTVAKGVDLFVVLVKKDADFMLAASHLGVRGFVDAEKDIEHLLSVIHMQDRRRDGKTGMISCFFSLKGGVGRTALATNIASNIDAMASNHAVLLDLNVPLGDTSLYLDMDENRMYTVTDFIHNFTRFDDKLIYKSLNQHPSGLYVLPLPAEIAELDSLNGHMIKNILEVLRKYFDHIVIDCADNFSDVILSCLDQADNIVLVSETSLSSLRATNKGLQVIRRLGYNEAAIKLIMNRYHAGSDTYLNQIIEALQVPTVFYVNNDFMLFNESLKNAVLINAFSKESVVNQQLVRIAQDLHLDEDKSFVFKTEKQVRPVIKSQKERSFQGWWQALRAKRLGGKD
ncbi:AAA family ATPase [Thiomicrospira microaerophila]|uniref:AAA family ATPase n=1 Tax=Thiomicrospira microaerophila TaxID=406020 RepID=UPI00201059F6|nr:AAA family ATPase [Thiomicrospira microaerophila]UQB43067.1 AAA family ATPase [Thiomicrospira microaerophila]